MPRNSPDRSIAPISDASSTAQTSAGSRARIEADRAELVLGEVMAAGARMYALRNRYQRVCESAGLAGGLLEQVIREPHRRLAANSGQLRELGREVFYR